MKKITFASLSAGSAALVLASQTFAVGLCPVGSFCATAAPSPDTIVPKIITLIFVIAAFLAVIFLVLGGIKWIMAGGDKTKVQAARESIIGAIIGLVVAFAAFFIINFVLKLLFGTDLFSANFSIPTGLLTN